MKAQFKHAFLSGLYARGGVFAVIFVINFIFITLGSLGLLPFAAQVTAVSLGGVAIAVMMAANIIGDVIIIRQMFVAPGAYLYALTPRPRRNILLVSVLTMAVMDIVTMAVVITSEVWLSLMLAGDGIISVVWSAIIMNPSEIPFIVSSIAILIAGYLLIMMIILLCVAMKKSIFYQKPAGRLMNVILTLGICYAVSLTPFLLVPIGAVSRFGLFFTITIDSRGAALYALLTLIESAVLFVLTARLMERKLNI